MEARRRMVAANRNWVAQNPQLVEFLNERWQLIGLRFFIANAARLRYSRDMKSTFLFAKSALCALTMFGFCTALPAHEADSKKDAAAASGVPKDYPLKKCVVSGDTLGAHGKPSVAKAPDGTVVYLCCKECIKDFKKDPEKYAQMVKDARAKK